MTSMGGSGKRSSYYDALRASCIAPYLLSSLFQPSPFPPPFLAPLSPTASPSRQDLYPIAQHQRRVRMKLCLPKQPANRPLPPPSPSASFHTAARRARRLLSHAPSGENSPMTPQVNCNRLTACRLMARRASNVGKLTSKRHITSPVPSAEFASLQSHGAARHSYRPPLGSPSSCPRSEFCRLLQFRTMARGRLLRISTRVGT